MRPAYYIPPNSPEACKRLQEIIVRYQCHGCDRVRILYRACAAHLTASEVCWGFDPKQASESLTKARELMHDMIERAFAYDLSPAAEEAPDPGGEVWLPDRAEPRHVDRPSSSIRNRMDIEYK